MEITTKQVNGKPIAAVLYFRAVAAAAGAELCERYRSYDTTNNGSQKAEEMTPTIEDYKRDLRFAIRDLKSSSSQCGVGLDERDLCNPKRHS